MSFIISLDVLLYDTSGESGNRSARLKTFLEINGCNVTTEKPTDSSSHKVYLCHKQQANKSIKESLAFLSKKGYLAVIYTAGINALEQENGIYYKTLDEIEKIFSFLPTNSTISDLKTYFDPNYVSARIQSFTALAILAQCVNVDGSAFIKQRAKTWRENVDCWKPIINSLPMATDELIRMAEKKINNPLLIFLTGSTVKASKNHQILMTLKSKPLS